MDTYPNKPASFMELFAPHAHAYLESLLPSRHPIVQELEQEARKDQFPIIGPQCGSFLEMMARITQAESILELGSGYGYSAYWFLRGMNNGSILLTDSDKANRDRALDLLNRTGSQGRIEFKVGDSIRILEEEQGPFDIIFCDIDKENYPSVPEKVLPKLRTGGLMIVDNTLWYGNVFAGNTDNTTKSILKFNNQIATDNRWFSIQVPIRDGISVSMKME